MAHGVIAGARALAQLAPIGVGLILVSPSLALVGSCLLVPFGIGLAALRRRWKTQNATAQSLAEELQTGVDELLENLDLWRVHAAGDRVRESLSSLSERAARVSSRVEAQRAALSGTNEVLAALALVGVIALASRAGMPLGDGTLVAFAAMFFMAYRPLRDLGDARAWCVRGTAALEAIADSVVEPAEGISPRAALAPQGELRACRMGARTRGPRTSFCLAPGESLSIVGDNGSGKTTLLRVLLGLEPALGSLTWAGSAVESAGVGPKQRPFAWAPQDAPLVTGTVVDNVALSCGNVEVARRALESLGLSELAELGDVVGPGGRPLSGGERRLVSLARAVASDAPVLLLDEPTAGLSLAAKARVLDALRRLEGKRGLIVVTHDPEVQSATRRSMVLGGEPAALAAE